MPKGGQTVTLLKVAQLSKRFGAHIAVDRVDLDVAPGEIVGLLGPNGAGKTTTIRTLLGIYASDEGTISFGPELPSLDHVGYLPEERGLYPDAPVLEALTYLGSLKGLRAAEARRRGLRWLDRLELSHCAGRRIETLSKGMQQKVQFIAAVLHRPVLAVLDEPFSGLDPVNQELFLSAVRELHEQGTTLLISSHQMNLVETLCRRVVVINQGRVVLAGSVADVKRTHGVRRVDLEYEGDASFLGEQPGIAVIQQADGRCTLELSDGLSPNEFLGKLSGRLEVQSLKIGWPPLHDVFIATIRGAGATHP